MLIHKVIAAAVSSAWLLELVACTQAPVPVAQTIDTRAVDEAHLRATVERWKAAISQHYLETILAFYTDDGWQLPENGPIARTAAERREFWEKLETLPIAIQIADVTDRIEVARSGDLAVQYGEYRQIISNKTGATTSVPQNFVTIWRKQPDGTWKVSASMATLKN
jgi:ketosteroid isomerase-like protein